MRMWHHYSSHSVNYSCGRRRKDIEANEKLYTPLPLFFLLFSHSPGKCQISTELQARLNHPTSQHESHVTDTYEEGTRRDAITLHKGRPRHTPTHIGGTYSAPMQRRLTTYHTLAYIKMLPMIALKKKKNLLSRRTDVTGNTVGRSFS